MKNKLLLVLLGAIAVCWAACSGEKKTDSTPDVKVHWSARNLPLDSTGVQRHMQTLLVSGKLDNVKQLAFNHFQRGMKPMNPADTFVEIVPNYYAIASPRFAQAKPGDTIAIEILTDGTIESICYGVESVHTVLADGTTAPAELTFADMTVSRDGYAGARRDLMPYGDTVYAFNESLKPCCSKNSIYNVVPSFKNIELTGGESTVNPAEATFKPIGNATKDGEYRITVADGKMTVEAPEKQWAQLGMRMRHLFGDKPAEMLNAVITDYPSLEYRGLMIDIARNFQKPEEMKRVLDLMAIYGLNTLHFHCVDDEAWRVEIDGLPELTELGSRHGYYAPGSDPDYLPVIYAGDGNPDSKTGTANGYFTRQDYVDMVHYADSLGIVVIPEIESPGHARASIKAMELRAKRTGDNSWLLRETDDASTFSSAQAFRDNVMSPALEGPYKFMDKVADEFIAMHKEAGAPIPAIHIGGDEVAHGAWSGSPKVQELMKKEGLTSEKEVHAYFADRVRQIFDAKGIKYAGWQEVSLRHPDEYNKKMSPSAYSINCWSTLGRNKTVPDELAKAGYPIVLSNVEHYYLDMAYSGHPHERGLTWGGFVDEFTALNGYPATLCTVKDANLRGIQGQLWSESIRGPENLEELLLPKMLGLAERAWNPDSTYCNAGFNAVVNKEVPKWQADGYTFHVRQPGIKLLDGGKFTVNSSFPDAVIRYTFGTEHPGENSPVAKPGEEIEYGDAEQIRAVQWVEGRPSHVSVLYTK